MRHAARTKVPRTVMDLLAPNMVLVFCQVGQVAEIGKGPNHAHRLHAGQGGQFFLQGLASQSVCVAAKRYRQATNLFNQAKRLLALLFANHIAQNTTQPADVVHQGAFLLL